MRLITLMVSLVLAMSPAAHGQRPGEESPETRLANRHYANGWAAIRTESWDHAVREFQQAVEADPRFALAYYSLGRAYMGQRDFPHAIAAYIKCRDMFVNDGSQQITNQRELRQRLNDRIAQYQMALDQARARTNAASAGNQSQSLYARNLQMSITRLEQARDRSDSFTLDVSVPYFVPMALGAAYFRSGRFADAEREYKEAIATNAGSGETHNNLAVLYLTTGRYDEAASEVKAAEKTGFRVNENLKSDILQKKRAGS